MTIRMLLAKVGIDGHDRGVRMVATTLRKAGVEVIYTGPFQTIQAVTEAAIQEDVNFIGISTLAGDYLLIPKLMAELQKREVDIPVVVGGIVPANAEDALRKAGVADVFHPGASDEAIVERILSLHQRRQS